MRLHILILVLLTCSVSMVTAADYSVSFNRWVDRSGDGLRQVEETETPPYVSPSLEKQSGSEWIYGGGSLNVTPDRVRTWSGLQPGHYRMFMPTTFPDFSLTTANVGTDDTIDSDFAANGIVEFDVINSNLQFDVGFLSRKANVILSSWIDRSRDGLRQVAETEVLPYQVVNLDKQSGTSWVFVNGSTPTIAPDGTHTWSQLMPGHYRASFRLYPDFFLTTANAGSDDTIDSDVNPAGQIEFDIDGANLRFDAGYVDRKANVILSSWIDRSRDGLRQVTETEMLPYQYVTLDMQAGTSWMSVNGSTPTIAPDGTHTWSQLMPGHYRASYCNSFSDFSLTSANIGTDDTIDSDVNSAGQIEFDIDGANLRFDAGYVQVLGSIGGRVWFDGNANGVQDIGEPGRAGVVLACSTYGSQAQFISSVTTDSLGFYTIPNLPIGMYRVVANTLNGQLSLTDSGTNDLVDSDFMNDGSVVVSVSSVVPNVRDAGIQNRAPTVSVSGAAVPEDTATALTLSALDADGDTYVWAISTLPAHGVILGTAPNLTYIPAADWSGNDSVTVQVTDSWGLSGIATLAITVTAVNDAPIISVTAAQTSEDTAVALSMAASDVDGDALTWAVTTAPTRGTLQGTAPALTYVPQANWSGTDSITVSVTDPSGLSASTTLNITVTAVNDAPTINVTAAQTSEDTAVTLSMAASDVDGDALTWAVTTAPTRGTLQGTAPALTYVPKANWSGTDSITVRVTDPSGLTASATLAITVTAVNDAPTLAAIALATGSNTQVLRTLVGADVDGDVLTYRLASVATSGTASISGNTLTYVPNANAIGSDSFTVEAVDPSGSAGAALVSVTITGAGMPVPWALSEIGTVTPVSTTNFNWATNIFTLSGAGLGLIAKADSAALLSQSITGDVTIIAKVASQVAVGSTSRAGLTFRDTTASGSRHASLLVSPTNGLSFVRRTTLNSTTSSTSGGTPSPARRWLRLQRVGTKITASSSANGTTWTVLSSATVSLNAVIQVGLISTSGVSGATSAATFESVQIILPAALRANG